MTILKASLISLLALSLPLASFAQNTQTSVAGAYADMGADTGSIHYLTPNGGYCFMLSAGSLDLNFGGKWTAKPAKNGSQSVEIKPEFSLKTMFPVWLNNSKKEEKRQLTVNGYRISESGINVMLGFGNSPEKPERFGALFKTDEQATMNNYTVAIPENMKYMFVGYQTDEGKYTLERYEIPKKIDKLFRLSFDFNAYYVKKMGTLHAIYKDNKLKFLNEQGETAEPLVKKSLTKEQFAQVDRECVQPMLNGDTTNLFDSTSKLLPSTTILWQGKPTLDSWQKNEIKQ